MSIASEKEAPLVIAPSFWAFFPILPRRSGLYPTPHGVDPASRFPEWRLALLTHSFAYDIASFYSFSFERLRVAPGRREEKVREAERKKGGWGAIDRIQTYGTVYLATSKKKKNFLTEAQIESRVRIGNCPVNLVMGF